MKAAVWTKYGPPEVVQITDIPKPVPKDNEILIKVKASSLSRADCEMRKLDFAPYIKIPMRLFAGLVRPKRINILGQELSGIVEAAGSQASGFKPGDEVLASTGYRLGAHSEYVCLPVNNEDALIAKKPGEISFEEAACIPASGIEAYCFLKKAGLIPGQKIMIIGAGGSFGTFAVQFAKQQGCTVSAVDQGSKAEMLKKAGADEFIDYTKTEYTKSDIKYDVIFDVLCKKKLGHIRNILKKEGTYLAGNPKMAHLLRSSKTKKNGKIFIAVHSGKHTVQDLESIITMIENKSVQVIIDRTFKLDDILDAFQLAESENKQGHIVLTVSSAE